MKKRECWLMYVAFAGLCVLAFAAVPLEILPTACSEPREPLKFQTAESIKIMVCELQARSGALKIMVFELQAASGSIKTMVFHALNSFLLQKPMEFMLSTRHFHENAMKSNENQLILMNEY